ncbi:MAG: hypothetical protein WC840_04135 [Candidatus Peribacteraceae bacterium]
MGEKMTWEAITKKYPDEWVLVTDYEFDEYGEVREGVLIIHSRNKEDVFSYPVESDKVGLWYTGESNFRGFRSHAEHYQI